MRGAGAADDRIAEQGIGVESSGGQRSQILEACAGVGGVRDAVEAAWNAKDLAWVGAQECAGVLIADHYAVAAPGAGGGVLRVALAAGVEDWIRDDDCASGETCAALPRSFLRGVGAWLGGGAVHRGVGEAQIILQAA